MSYEKAIGYPRTGDVRGPYKDNIGNVGLVNVIALLDWEGLDYVVFASHRQARPNIQRLDWFDYSYPYIQTED